MQTTVVDLRYRMRDILKALDRRERVQILYHGRIKGEIVPAGEPSGGLVEEHPFFGMYRDHSGSVDKTMKDLRKGRTHAF
ncbi:MAG: type II toxin-antitoxin system Phd/YefM family antitoxin [Candidatus Omnitrophica bacterium]|nr:type II toxin-antitoxin system Phd/YefM family antitoxin [Candidatus Omnitrophota bacterium]